jgi:hypothetical protein
MNATAENRLLAYKRRLLILDLLENQNLTVAETANKICDSFLIIKSEIQKLYKQKHLTRNKKFDSFSKKRVYAYTTINKNFPMPNIKATDDQIKKVDKIDLINDTSRKRKPLDLPKQLMEHKRIVVDPKNPNCTTYLNLGRAGSDYAWQRPKRKHTAVSIGSTFSLMDYASN